MQTFEIGPDSVSEWLEQLKSGNELAAEKLWKLYFEKLITTAAKQSRKYGCPTGKIDVEAVAASVFESLWSGANAGRFEKVEDRSQLSWLLQAMVCRKVVSYIRRELAEKRGGRVPHVSLSSKVGELLESEPSPESVSLFEEQYNFLLGLLRDAKLRQIAVLKVEGASNEDIRNEVGVSSATLTRKLSLIRSTWQKALDDQGFHDDGIR
ncbi:MAG: ECF-type sigma factor [Planctomycetaceae bacterium]